MASKMVSDDIRRIIVEEVNNHLGPIATKVDRLDVRMRSLYSNGSGGPPGYLEMARAQDDERYQRLFNIVEEMKEQRKKLWAAVLHIGWKVAIAVLSALAALTGWAYHDAVPVMKILWEDYQKAHPAVTEKLKNRSGIPDPAVSSNQTAGSEHP